MLFLNAKNTVSIIRQHLEKGVEVAAKVNNYMKFLKKPVNPRTNISHIP
jgi:hypothetical protein